MTLLKAGQALENASQENAESAYFPLSLASE
jgi:hypothetical protein